MTKRPSIADTMRKNSPSKKPSAAVPVAEGDTEDSLAARVLEEEHRIFPAAIRLYVDGRLRTDGRQVHILPPAEGGAL